ncbi:hypothetical protein CERSUDRAFT_113114 [Gelatoporia subvermispora B]|uniref:Protein-S-isoprenylcysteine O-methyltransferase n=1 Tax=Ceriporiopsis subvermispora (strain B) TaxID=914234 RepID=M2PNK5_CERS8|nr:hypothetical protein CERSUDRAFT_113114 [Gelatoporia subvermispora B]
MPLQLHPSVDCHMASHTVFRCSVYMKLRETACRTHLDAMSLLTPVLNTPLLKIPIVIARASIIDASCSPPPTPPAKVEEASRFGEEDLLLRIGGPKLAVAMRIVSWMSSICEAVAVAAAHLPSEFSSTVLSALSFRPGSEAYTLYISPQWILGVSLVYIGGLTRIACHNTLGKYFTWNLAVRDDHKLITSGLYSIVRHPAYTGMLLIGAGNLLCMTADGSWWKESGLLDTPVGSFLRPAWIAYWIVIPFLVARRAPMEDVVLSKEFGDEWKAWAKRTPYRLIPFIY